MKMRLVKLATIVFFTIIFAVPSFGVTPACQTEINKINQALTDYAPALTPEIVAEVIRLRDLGQTQCPGDEALGLATLAHAKQYFGIQ